MQGFLKKCGNILKEAFKLGFGRDDPEFLRALSLEESAWQIIAMPQKLGDGTLTLFHYENKMVRSGILAVKRRNNPKMADIFAGLAADFLLEELSEMEMMHDFKDPIIIGIPMSKKNLLNKGFNHAEEVAKKIAALLPPMEFMRGALEKTRATAPQKNLSRAKRLTNVSHSMMVSRKYLDKIKARCVIVLDDVSTTGATLSEARRALLAANARKVLCFALAH
ncbi:MAG: hypothetical protein V4438_02605 [Patescibacteria group bacterium]